MVAFVLSHRAFHEVLHVCTVQRAVAFAEVMQRRWIDEMILVLRRFGDVLRFVVRDENGTRICRFVDEVAADVLGNGIDRMSQDAEDVCPGVLPSNGKSVAPFRR